MSGQNVKIYPMFSFSKRTVRQGDDAPKNSCNYSAYKYSTFIELFHENHIYLFV